MKYEAIIFDLDGTILNTLPDLTQSVNFALNTYNYPIRTTDEVRSFIGNGVGLLIKRSLPSDADDETINNVLSVFKKHYSEHYADKTVPYDEITDLLKNLKTQGYKLAVVSNKFDSAVKALCEKFFFGIFDFVLGETENIPRKPAPDSLNVAIDNLNVKKENVLYIGDSEVDIKTAQNAEVDCLSVLWGFKDKEFLIKNGASAFADSPNDIIEFVK